MSKPGLLLFTVSLLAGGLAAWGLTDRKGSAASAVAAGTESSSGPRPASKWSARDLIGAAREVKFSSPLGKQDSIYTDEVGAWSLHEIRAALEASFHSPESTLQTGALAALPLPRVRRWSRR